MNRSTQERLEYDVFSLHSVAAPEYAVIRQLVLDSLSRFECAKSPHLENFARNSVLKYEQNGNSRTYVLVTFSDSGDLDVAAFFTVGMASLDFSKLSNSAKKKLMGDVSKEVSGAYAIAELARSDSYSSSVLPGSMILDEAKKVIFDAHKHVGGRLVVVDTQQVIFDTLYKSAGFRRLHVTKPPKGMEDKDFITAGCLVRDW